MARKVFFSFHYDRDLWRVNVVRNSGTIEGVSVAGFHDASLWEEAKKSGDAAVKKLIDASLADSTVTVVLIGSETADREWINYEIQQSISRGNGILGIRINSIKDKNGHPDSAGPIPTALSSINAPIYDWDYGKLGEWVEEAYRKAKQHS